MKSRISMEIFSPFSLWWLLYELVFAAFLAVPSQKLYTGSAKSDDNDNENDDDDVDNEDDDDDNDNDDDDDDDGDDDNAAAGSC